MRPTTLSTAGQPVLPLPLVRARSGGGGEAPIPETLPVHFRFQAP